MKARLTNKWPHAIAAPLGLCPSDNSISWIGSVSEELENRGPVRFSLRRLHVQPHLFAHRSALFYTPTKSVPAEYVGSGPLNFVLPIASPDYTDLREIPAYMNPRLWVDLIQRQTGKLRWEPMFPAKVSFVRYDCFSIRHDHLVVGMKALRDALKLRTSGRRDGIYLHYFGAIVDDAEGFADFSYSQKLVVHPGIAKIKVRVLPLKNK